MSLYSFKEFLITKPKDKLFIADTSFLINSLIKDSEEYNFRKAISGKIGLAYNVVIRSEVIHITRQQFFSFAFENNKIDVHKSVKSLWNITQPHERLKQICQNGYAEIFREYFGDTGQTLKAEVEKVFHGCIYVDGKNNKNSANWDRVYALMSTYGLDSSDAMITNFAVGDATFSGIISSDADFRVCGDVESSNPFDIILPEGPRKRVLKKNWKPD